MAVPDRGQRAVDAGTRAVDQPVDRVLQDRVTQYGDAATHSPATSSGQPVSATPTLPSPFPDAPFDAGLVPVTDQALEVCLTKIKNEPQFKNLSVALVDLTASDSPRYWGFNDTKQVEVGSLAKIGAMFAAYQLREAIITASEMVTAKTGADMLAEIQRQWDPVIKLQTPKMAADPADDPKYPRKLTDIFSATFDEKLGWIVDFIDSKKTLDELEVIHKDPNLPAGLGFLDRMKLMIGWSDNLAAWSCIKNLGFRYINGALQSAGLYDPNSGGIWLGFDYQLKTWSRGPSGKERGAHALAVARFLTLLAQDKLINRTACIGMKQLMSISRTVENNFFKHGLGEKRKPGKFYEKVGVWDNNNDCAYIERGDSITLRYVAVGLNSSNTLDPKGEILKDLIVRLDDCLLSAHSIL